MLYPIELGVHREFVVARRAFYRILLLWQHSDERKLQLFLATNRHRHMSSR